MHKRTISNSCQLQTQVILVKYSLTLILVQWCNKNLMKLNVNESKGDFLEVLQSHKKCISCQKRTSRISFFFNDYFHMTSHLMVILTRFLLLHTSRFSKKTNVTKDILTLFNAMIRIIMEYCSTIWDPSYAVHTG